MPDYTSRLFVIAVVLWAGGFAGLDSAMGDEDVAELTAYLREHGLSPQAYIISKFTDHDVIFIGEWHRIRHDPLFIQSLIPVLYSNGIRRLGFEFANYADQELIDRLLMADRFDESLAERILWNCNPFWGYREYRDVFRAAWEVNGERKEEEKPFRVFGLCPRSDWSHVKKAEDRNNRRIMRRVWGAKGSEAVYTMAVQREIVDAGEKGVVYAGINHCYTRYRQPKVDQKGEFAGFDREGRMGNQIYERIGGRCMTVCLHACWPSAEGYGKPGVRAADGMIDAVIAQLGPEYLPVAVDTMGTPFGALKGETCLWKHGYRDFSLADYCDGYIMTMPLSEYEGVTVIPDWFTEKNRSDAIAQCPNPAFKTGNPSVEQLFEAIAKSANIRNRFEHLTREEKVETDTPMKTASDAGSDE